MARRNRATREQWPSEARNIGSRTGRAGHPTRRRTDSLRSLYSRLPVTSLPHEAACLAAAQAALPAANDTRGSCPSAPDVAWSNGQVFVAGCLQRRLRLPRRSPARSTPSLRAGSRPAPSTQSNGSYGRPRARAAPLLPWLGFKLC